MHHIMLDLETYGTRPGCKIAAIGAVLFHYENGVYDKFYQEFQRDNQGPLIEDPATLEWWSKQSEQSRTVIDGPMDDRPLLIQGLMSFGYWLEKLGKRQCVLIGNSARFDCGILDTAYATFGMEIPWNSYNETCYRTVRKFLGASVKEPKREGVAHNALDDALHQTKYYMMMMKAYKGLGI